MEWPVLIIALIPIAVWILATIFRGVEEAQEMNRPRPRNDGAQVKVPRRPASELDRFLDEARRRRDPPQQRREVPTAEPVVVERPPVEMPAPRPVRREEPKPRPKAEPRPVPMPVPMPAAVAMPEPAPPPPRPTQQRRPVSPLMARFGGLMRDRDSLALALMIREVFDKPVSQRKR